MKIVQGILKLRAKKKMERIYREHNHGPQKQLDILMEILHDGTDCDYGLKYNFKNITDYESFKKSMPVVTHDDIKPLIDKMISGQENILWPGKVPFFAKSSGTSTGISKFLPVTDESLEENHYKAGRDMYLSQINNNPEVRWWKGKTVVIGGSIDINEKTEIGIGDISGVLMNQSPWWTGLLTAPEDEILLEPDWSTKLDNIVEKIIHENITSFAGVPTWTLKIIQRALEMSGKKKVKDLWPDFALYIHGGVSFEPYKKVFEELLPKNTIYKNIYNASEGYFAYQDSEKDDELLLCLEHGIFFEFLSKDKSEIHTIEAAKLNTPYALVITTNAGLWRYNIGDVVELVSKNPYRVRILGRTKQCINIFGEELMEHNTNMAINHVCEKFEVSLQDYTVGAKLSLENGFGQHIWAIELISKESINIEQFESELDKSLRNLNSDYEAKRNGSALKMAKIHMVSSGSFSSWLEKHGKMGQSYKVPRLKSNMSVVDEITNSS